MTERADGFLGRWARRKNDALLGKPLTEPAPPVTASMPVPVPPPAAVATNGETAAQQDSETLPTLSLDDVKLLTKDSDFKPFMAHNVGPDVRNAAMKKLFEDPHFNIMDGLDIYIDDYSISEPIPESMLRQMASAKFLNLFEETDEEKEAARQAEKQAAEKTVEQASKHAVSNQHDQRELLTQDLAVASSAGSMQPEITGTMGTTETPETSNTNADPSVAQSVTSSSTQPAPNTAAVLTAPFSQPEVSFTPVASQENHADPYLRLQPDHAPSAPEAGRSS